MNSVYGYSPDNHFTCPAEALAGLLGKKWVPSIIEELYAHELRFGELQRHLGSTPKMVKQQLALLEENGIVENQRMTYNNTIESTYYLTEKGKSLFFIVKQMKDWGNSHLQCSN
ncbi:winged helix-turn-helix transcriptional regulator [Enterococcus dongliensis]|uniref:winged helix-turn-helix transcriptional regulator n=1 Tax=Enterococcus dongliensis TaxID=2559925 RepID=UPI00288E13CA|nr:helix-turn-helix domain-containing protein [Enterococcus dongliensis]MDT2613290.1 helix-turn-helix domain-containing protein [Enterococcus dongliensis]